MYDFLVNDEQCKNKLDENVGEINVKLATAENEIKLMKEIIFEFLFLNLL